MYLDVESQGVLPNDCEEIFCHRHEGVCRAFPMLSLLPFLARVAHPRGLRDLNVCCSLRTSPLFSNSLSFPSFACLVLHVCRTARCEPYSPTACPLHLTRPSEFTAQKFQHGSFQTQIYKEA
jgi:hypothetical protein